MSLVGEYTCKEFLKQVANEVLMGIPCCYLRLMTYACLHTSCERQAIADTNCHLSA